MRVILDRSPETLEKHLSEWASHPLAEGEKQRLLKLLELQRHALLMFTSCGWFFDEVSGLETVQVMQYAARALQLGRDLFGEDLEPQYLERLANAKSNIPEKRDGRFTYEQLVKTAEVDLVKLAAHYAIRSLFVPYDEGATIYSYRVDHEEHETNEAGELRLQVGRVRLSSAVTLESGEFSYAVLHLGDQNLVCKLRVFDEQSHGQAATAVKQAFESAEVAEIIRVLDEQYGETTYSMSSLFRDEQRQILEVVTGTALRDAEATNRAVYERHAPLLMFLAGLGAPAPKTLHSAAELVLNADLRTALEDDGVRPDTVKPLLEAVGRTGVQLDGLGLGYAFELTLERLSERLLKEPENEQVLATLLSAARVLPEMPFGIDLRLTQNHYFQVSKGTLPAMRHDSEQGGKGRASGSTSSWSWVACCRWRSVSRLQKSGASLFRSLPAPA